MWITENYRLRFEGVTHLASWAKSSTSLARNLGHRMIAVESYQAKIRSKLSSLRQDTSNIKSMMIEIYQAFKVVIKEPPSHIEGETKDMETKDTDKDNVEKEQVFEEPKHAVLISNAKPTKTPTPEV
ncbi:hypothetical protein Tco_1400904 [Tanacetum coccineum]